MRLNPFAPNDNPMDQVLFCFGSGEEKDEAAQEAADLRAAEGDTDELEDYYSSVMGDRLTGEDIMDVYERSTQLDPSNVLPGDDDFQPRRDFVPPQTRGVPVRDLERASDVVRDRLIETIPDTIPDIGPLDLLPTDVVERNRRMQAVESAPDNLDDGDLNTPDVDIFDTAYTGGATPAKQVIEQARGPGSPNDVRNQARNPGLPSAMTGLTTGRPMPEFERRALLNPLEEINPLSPGGIVRNVLQDFTKRDARFAEVLQRPDVEVRYDPDTNQPIAAYDPRVNAVYTPSDIGMFDIFEQERIAGDLYNMQRAEQERRMGRAGDDQPVVASTTMTPEAVTPEEVTQGFPITAPGAIPPFFGPYSPATQYTGIAGLPQFTLQPTYTAPTMFSPLYNIG